MARRAVAAVVEDAVRLGAEYLCAQVLRPTGAGRAHELATSDGGKISAGQFIFACGPWLGKVFSAVLRARIFSSRPEVFYFRISSGGKSVAAAAVPTLVIS